MNNLEKYLDQVIVQRPTQVDATPVPIEPQQPEEPEGPSAMDMFRGVLRRWYIVLGVFLLLCLPGIPAIWLLIEPTYTVAGTIHIAPILQNILTGDPETGNVSNYEAFVNTQAQIATGTRVVQRVADDTTVQGLSFFREQDNSPLEKIKRKLNFASSEAGSVQSDPVQALQEAIRDREIFAAPLRKTEYMSIAMKYANASEASRIVDAFIRHYLAVQETEYTEGAARELQTLEERENLLEGKLGDYRSQINGLAQRFGTKNLEDRHDMKLQRVGSLLAELTKLQARRINLEIRVKVLEKMDVNEPAVDPGEMVQMRQQFINNDRTVSLLTANIAQMEQALVEARQLYTESNPEIKRKEELIAAMQQRLEEAKTEAGKSFEELMANQKQKSGVDEVELAKKELEEVAQYEQSLRETLGEEDTETINIGQNQLMIQDLEEQYALTKELYDAVRRRIEVMKLQQQRPGRVSVAEYAKVADVQDKRAKFTLALVFGSLALGGGLAFLKDKADHSLRTPDDVARRIGLRIIGTTTSSQTVNPARLQEHVVGDYQTIRANLGLLNGSGLPKRLVVASPSTREGKTTFAINLATSIAWSGKSVLLIDGDLRKPDIGPLLGVPKEHRGLQNVLLGGDSSDAIYSVPSSHLDVLVPHSAFTTDAFEMIASPLATQRIEAISEKYDHVIIDTPPVLAFSDALVWAKIAGAVVLTSFAGQTKAPDMKETKHRLTEIGVKVLGTVMSNVEPGSGYYPYGKDYYQRGDGRRARRRMLLTSTKPSN